VSDAAASLASLLAEKHRRELARAETEAKKAAEQAKTSGSGEEQKRKIAALCVTLRSRFHPKQAAFYDRTKNVRAALWRGASLCTRRAGKTAGGTREVLSRCLEQPGYRSIYCGQTREEVKRRAWESDTKDGFLDLLDEHGEPVPKSKTVAYDIAGVRAFVNRQSLVIDFANGSQIVLFAANHKKDQRKLRGGAKHLVWIDEAQEFLELTNFIESVCSALVKDYKGETWLTGTPSEDCAGYFYEVTCEPESGDTPRPGWDVHRYAVTDNPFFGRVIPIGASFDVVDQFGESTGNYNTLESAQAAAEILRWDATAGATLKENNWTGDEPAFLREYRGKWTKLDALFVYPVNAVPEHVLHWKNKAGEWAPMRLDADGWLNYEAAILDLPTISGYWLTSVGVDFGYLPHPFAIHAWSFALELEDVYELFSWKKTGVLPDDQRDYLHRLVRQIEHLAVMVGDPGGQKLPDLIAWKERTGLPIEPADKSQKRTWQQMIGGDIRKGHVKFRKGSTTLHEMKHLMEKRLPTGKVIELDNRVLTDGTVPGNDCADSSLYSKRHIYQFLHKSPEDKPPPGSPEAYKIEEEKLMKATLEQAKKERPFVPVWGGDYGSDW
jgi:hypothetical protein